MKLLKLLVALSLSIMLVACMPSEKHMHAEQNNTITEVVFSDLPSDKYFLIVGNSDDSTESLVTYMKKSITLEEGNNIYLLYTESDDKVSGFFDIKNNPMLFLMDGKKITDKVEFYNKQEIKEMSSDKAILKKNEFETNVYNFMKKHQ